MGDQPGEDIGKRWSPHIDGCQEHKSKGNAATGYEDRAGIQPTGQKYDQSGTPGNKERKIKMRMVLASLFVLVINEILYYL